MDARTRPERNYHTVVSFETLVSLKRDQKAASTKRVQNIWSNCPAEHPAIHVGSSNRLFCLTVAAQGQLVAPLVVGALGGADLVGKVALGAQATVALASRGQAAQLAVLLGGGAKPVGAGVVADGIVGWVYGDDLKVLEGGVLIDPVGVHHTESSTLAAHALLSHAAKVAGGLQLRHTLVGGLSANHTPLHGLLAASTAHTGAVHHEALLGLVAHAAGLVRAGGVGDPHNGRQLPVLPAAHAQQEAEHIALLLFPQLLNVLVGSHC
mmetsp:Transcript_20260/g.56451  ORF Transcript_20260/g.56451 Transcript_20260/m.56451 type:complete len:266 (+) Transcript_20260:184-981(+)